MFEKLEKFPFIIEFFCEKVTHCASVNSSFSSSLGKFWKLFLFCFANSISLYDVGHLEPFGTEVL